MLDQTEDKAPEAEAPADDLDAPEFHPELDTLMGDLRDVMLGRIRTTRKPWEQMSEDEQIDLANGIELAAKDMIRRTVRLLNNYPWPHAAVLLGEVKIKGAKGIEAKVTCDNIELNRTVLGDHIGQHVMVLMVDSDRFMAHRAPVDIKPDQPELPIEDGEAVGDPQDYDRRPAGADLE
jgi:hypothetical protein